jgi:hypothetical protein
VKTAPRSEDDRGRNMTTQDGIAANCPTAANRADVVELCLLLPASHFSALTVVAVSAELSVEALLSRIVGDFLQSPAAVGFVGEVAGRPTAPLPLPRTSGDSDR